MNMKRNTLLIIVIIILAGTLSFAFGYMYISAPKAAANNSANITTINQTMQNGTAIPYSSEYISFDKAKSIAKSKASKGVSVSDPILMKNHDGQAIYICNYYYNGQIVGGIILNAKTGAVIYRELNLPTNTTTTTTDQYNNQNYNDNSNYNNDDNYDNSNYNYDDSNDNYDDSSDADYQNYDDDYSSDYDGSDDGYY
ncbi:hypothetical protein [Methanobacterium lacus]|uniref:hypothetical protein n=1 Tax=Methanobacterium lacus (strain AL-21) TaxID=877455 RepID=UPI00065DED51|nr:hypothetical protein [Methanobacterium lacus]